MRAPTHQYNCDNQEDKLLTHSEDRIKETSSANSKRSQQQKIQETGRYKKLDASKFKKLNKRTNQQRNITTSKEGRKKQSIIQKVYASSRPKQINTSKQENKKNRPQHKSHSMNRYVDNKFNKFLMIGITLSFIIFVFIIMFVDLNKDAHPFSFFKIRLKKPINRSQPVFGFTVKQLGFDKYVQVGTQLDFLNLLQEKQYRRFVNNYDKYIQYRIYSGNELQLDNIPDINPLNANLKAESSIKTLLNSISSENVSQKVQQIPICIFTQLQSTPNEKLLNITYNNYFKSIGKQNYTNYKIILIDDNSNDNLTKLIYPIYRNNSMLKERITIIRNQRQLGKIGSFYIHKKYCLNSQVVMYIDVSDSLNGDQVLKTVSQIYSNPDIWMTYWNKKNEDAKQLEGQYFQKEKFLSAQSNSYNFFSSAQLRSGLVSHRVQLLKKLPIEHFIEYQYNFNDLSLKPVFYNCTNNQFLIYLLFQLCTSEHIELIDSYLYLQKRQKEMCSTQKQQVCEVKAKIKKKIKAIQTLSYNQSYKNQEYPTLSKPDYKTIKQYSEKIQKLSKCKNYKQINPQNN